MALALAIFFVLIWGWVILWMRARARTRATPDTVETVEVEIDGIARSYHILRNPRPGPGKRPVVLGLHGGGGGAERFARNSGLPSQCFAAGMDMIVPEAEGTWADGRDTTREMWDNDRALIDLILDGIANDPGQDETCLFAVGISNGAMFSIRLATMLGPRLSGICAVSGAVPGDYADAVKQGAPVPILMVNSDDDRLVPMRGGDMPKLGGLAAGGVILSHAESVAIWKRRNRCARDAQVHELEIGAVKASVQDHPAGENGADVSIVILQGAGHNWPDARPVGKPTLETLVIRFFQRQTTRAHQNAHPAGAPRKQIEFDQGPLTP